MLLGWLSGITALPKRALTTGARIPSATDITSWLAFNAPWPTRITILLPELMISAACSNKCLSGKAPPAATKVSDVCPGTICFE
jgi:hypothetical protein